MNLAAHAYGLVLCCKCMKVLNLLHTSAQICNVSIAHRQAKSQLACSCTCIHVHNHELIKLCISMSTSLAKSRAIASSLEQYGRICILVNYVGRKSVEGESDHIRYILQWVHGASVDGISPQNECLLWQRCLPCCNVIRVPWLGSMLSIPMNCSLTVVLLLPV